MLAKSYNSTPTFKGLLVKDFEGKGTTTLLPWGQLEQEQGTSWRVCQDDGTPLLRNGHPVAIRVDHSRAAGLTRRLFIRHLKPLWSNGSLTFKVASPHYTVDAWICAALSLTLGAVILYRILTRIPTIWVPDPPFLETRYLVLYRIMLSAGLAFGAGLIWLGIKWLPWGTRRSNAASIRISHSEICFGLLNGQEQRARWDDLRSLRRFLGFAMRLEINGQDPVVIRSDHVWPSAWRHFFTQSLPAHLRRPPPAHSRKDTIRMGLYCLVGAALAGAMAAFFADHPTLRAPAVGALTALVCFAVGLCLIALATEQTIRKKLRSIWRRYRKPRRERIAPAKP
jgi:hypothetical protein